MKYFLMDQAAGADAGGAGGGAPAAPAAGAAANTGGTPDGAATGGAPAGTESIDWLPNATQVDVGYVKNKGWTTPADIINSYRNAEKFISAPVDQRLVIPGEKAEPHEVDAFYNKLGRPAKAEEYKIPVPQGDKGEFAKTFGGWAHPLGLSQKQVEGIATKWNEHIANLSATEQTQRTEAFNTDAAKLKTEWGAAYDKNVLLAKEVGSKLGLDAATIDKMQDSLGHYGVMSLLAKIGSGLGEDTFVTGREQGSDGAMTPAQALAKIEELKADKGFREKYFARDAKAVAEMEALHKYAYPDVKA